MIAYYWPPLAIAGVVDLVSSDSPLFFSIGVRLWLSNLDGTPEKRGRLISAIYRLLALALTLLLVLLLTATTIKAQDLTGTYYDESNPGYDLMIDDTGNALLATMYVYDPETGERDWYISDVVMEDDPLILIPLFQGEAGPGFPIRPGFEVSEERGLLTINPLRGGEIEIEWTFAGFRFECPAVSFLSPRYCMGQALLVRLLPGDGVCFSPCGLER